MFNNIYSAGLVLLANSPVVNGATSFFEFRGYPIDIGAMSAHITAIAIAAGMMITGLSIFKLCKHLYPTSPIFSTHHQDHILDAEELSSVISTPTQSLSIIEEKSVQRLSNESLTSFAPTRPSLQSPRY